eukprot:6180268-Pleurochrysis_carterae.AAC.1
MAEHSQLWCELDAGGPGMRNTGSPKPTAHERQARSFCMASATPPLHRPTPPKKLKGHSAAASCSEAEFASAVWQEGRKLRAFPEIVH